MVEFSKNDNSICRRLVGDKSGMGWNFILGVGTLSLPLLHGRTISHSPRTDRNAIFFIRGQKVMLDADLAALYGVSTTRLNQAIKRNLKRFPSDFSTHRGRDQAFDITNCDTKPPGRSANCAAVSPLRVYRAGRSHAFICP